jgi:hypothetical protein
MNFMGHQGMPSTERLHPATANVEIDVLENTQTAGSVFPFQHTVPVVGEMVKSAATYNVVVQCGLQSPLFDTGMTEQMNKLIVWSLTG